MNSNDLFDIIGETPERYVRDAATVCDNTNRDHPCKKRRTVSKILLVAALISLLTVTVAAAAPFLRIWIKHEETFTNKPTESSVNNSSEIDTGKNGVIEFNISIDEEINGEPVPMLEVTPYFLTEEDVKQVAHILFPDGEFYEAEPALEQNYSSEELQEKIDRWSYYTTEETLRELIEYRPNQPEYLRSIAQNVHNFVDKYSEMLESAPSENPHELCDWTFKKDSVYSLTKAELATKDTSNDNDNIVAVIKVGDVRYQFRASTRNKDDFLISNISAYLYDGIGPDMIDERIFRAWLCKTDEPTDEQIVAVRTKAEAMLAEMELGEWLVDECFVEKEVINEYTYYSIHVNAVPVLNGTPALRKAQLTNLQSEESDAARYYYTDAQFEFSANGDLVSFELKSPIEIQREVTTNNTALEIEKQFETAKAYLSQRDFHFYSMGFRFDHLGETVKCIVDVNGLEYNLTRINGENPLESYFYVPGIKLIGNVRYYGAESGRIYLEQQGITLAIIDVESGSVVLTP